MLHKIYDPNCTSACFFRSTVQPPQMKVMLQITEKCNLRCAHCFAESEVTGGEMALASIENVIIPQFIKNQVVKVTLTGGEPLVHPHANEIVMSLLENNIAVSICTNGTLLDQGWIEQLSQYNNVHFNVSLDGLRLESHGRFRGNIPQEIFSKIIDNICILGRFNLLNGILTTPNKYASIDEYVALCQFALQSGAKYILMNPLSPFGRGTQTQLLAYSDKEMNELRKRTQSLMSDHFEIVYIRFPNTEHRPIGECPLGSIPYIFCNGDIAICPYMVFAASGSSIYHPNDFVVGNIFEGADIVHSINNWSSDESSSCSRKDKACLTCSRGCHAINIANNRPLFGCDFDMCPVRGE